VTGPRVRLAAIAAGAVVVSGLFNVACASDDGGRSVEAEGVETAAHTGSPAATLEVTANEYSFRLSAKTVAPGTVPVTLVNGGHEVHQVMIVRLHDGVTLAQYAEAAHADEAAAGALVDDAGGVNAVDPGSRATGYADLAPGRYAVLCYIPAPDGSNHLHHGMSAELTVVEAPEVPAPRTVADVTVGDFSFSLPAGGLAKAGAYRVVNTGRQSHEVVVLRIEDGRTLPEVVTYLQHGFTGDKPVRFVGGAGGVEPGHAGYMDLDLQPGQYLAMCFVQDPASHKAHAELGMIAPFSVA
jgi:uncharacterized cupredoxin-like copper-binding protein